MLWYILKLLVLLPLIAGLAWGCLKLAQKMQQRGLGNPAQKSVRVVETVMLSPTLKLAVIEFRGREILVSASRSGLVRLAEAEARIATGKEAALTNVGAIAAETAQALVARIAGSVTAAEAKAAVAAAAKE